MPPVNGSCGPVGHPGHSGTAAPEAADVPDASGTHDSAGAQGALEACGAPRGRDYFRSIEHLVETPEFREFLHREFPAGAAEMVDGDDRRNFLKIMGASMALAGLGLAGCRRWPEEHIAPYASRPTGRDPGVAVSYATSLDRRGVASPLLVTSSDGRPTKVEGNPEHPASRGAADHLAQASVLDLYDPDRSRRVLHNGEPSSFAEFAAWWTEHGASLGQGGKLAVLCEALSSPSFARLREAFAKKWPSATWHEYEPLANDEEIEGTVLAFGAPKRAVLDLTAADVIVSLDADLLGEHPRAVEHIRAFARKRSPKDGESAMSRLYVFESEMSLTGANADDRVPMRAIDVGMAAAYLAARVLDQSELKRFEEAPEAAQVLTADVRASLDRAAADLAAHPRRSVLAVGARQPAAVHVLVHAMNEVLGNVGQTVAWIDRPAQQKHMASLKELARRLEAGEVSTLVIIGGNPAYDAPSDLRFGEHLKAVANAVHLSPYADETSQRCAWHLPRAHYLECWGDARSWDGTYTAAQPLIQPLYDDSRSPIELLASVLGATAPAGQAIVQETFATIAGTSDEKQWKRVLHDGFAAGSAWPAHDPSVRAEAIAGAGDALFARWRAGQAGWELVFAAHPTILDGRYANNAWLQELPGPLTKLTWDNAVLLSPKSAAELDVSTGDLVTIRSGGGQVEAAVLKLPGLPHRSVTLQLGGGRGFAGRICTGAGFNFGLVRTSDAAGFANGAEIRPTGASYALACTQDHHTIDVNTVGGRSAQERLPQLFREADLAEWRSDPDFAKKRTHIVHRLSLWEESNLDGADFAWAMSIDLGKCVGCGACIVACQAENNIPVVGKDQVIRGREMHWLRVDRYFAFAHADGGYDPDRVERVAMQPLTCMQCENAPCEQVCPVAATVHDEDGLNVMVYNRCIGTRYCSNNCPYKVRRFNYFDYHRRPPHRERGLLHVDLDYYTKRSATVSELEQMRFNPEVTVRMRGVMEKCTYCVQRIVAARITTKNAFVNLPEGEKQRRTGERLTIPDGMVTPACAQTCPAEAIVFGDLRDPKSRVAALQSSPRSYQMLEELNVNARTKYLAKVRNPGTPSAAPSGSSHGSVHES